MNALHPGEEVTDRPDIACRVFKMKFNKLLHDLTKDMLLGKTKGYTCVVEWQKKGLPHVHTLLILEDQDKPRISLDR